MSVRLCHRLSGTQWQWYNGWYMRYVMRQQRHLAFPSGGLPPHGASEQRKPTSLVKFCTRRHASNKVTWPPKRLISNFTRCMNQLKCSGLRVCIMQHWAVGLFSTKLHFDLQRALPCISWGGRIFFMPTFKSELKMNFVCVKFGSLLLLLATFKGSRWRFSIKMLCSVRSWDAIRAEETRSSLESYVFTDFCC